MLKAFKIDTETADFLVVCVLPSLAESPYFIGEKKNNPEMF